MSATGFPSSRVLSLAIALALGLGLAACSKGPATAPQQAAAPAAPAGPSAADQAAQQQAQQQAAALAALPADELRKRGGDALREQRLYAPAGNNAMEYYLALRGKSDKPDVSAESALMDLAPYAVIAAEQALGRSDFIEAERLRSLIERTDPQAPALPRIADAIAKGKAAAAQKVVDDAAKADQAAKADELAKQKATQQAAQQQAADQAAATAARAAPPPSAPQPVAPAPAPVQAAPAPVQAAPAPARSSGTPVAISTPQPDYPPEALRAGVTGEIEVQFTVNTDGSVSDVRVVKANPRGAFDRAVRGTVSRWRYQPMDQPATVHRTFSFKQ